MPIDVPLCQAINCANARMSPKTRRFAGFAACTGTVQASTCMHGPRITVGDPHEVAVGISRPAEGHVTHTAGEVPPIRHPYMRLAVWLHARAPYRRVAACTGPVLAM